MFDVHQTLQRQEVMATKRAGFESRWSEAADLFLPRQADFFQGRVRSQGEDRQNHVFDEYGQEALEDGVSMFEGFVMPRGSLWQALVAPADSDLAKLQHVRAWFERKTLKLFGYRNDPMSGFAMQSVESVASLMCFGNQAMTVDIRRDPVTKAAVGLSYRSEHIGQCWIDQSWNGLIGRRHRKFMWSAEQALEYWGPEKLQRAPKVLEAASSPKRATTEFEFLHAIIPNNAVMPDRWDWRGKPYGGGYLSIADKEWVEIGGYGAAPLTFSRFSKSPAEWYGRGPGTRMLPAIKAAQQLMLDLMVGAELALMPPIGAHDDMLDQMINYGAREVTYGAIDSRGQKMVDRLIDVGDMNPALAIQQRIEKMIDHAFYRDLLAINQELKSHVTDTQLYDRNQEKGILLSPLSRQETEWFAPMSEREIELMAQMGDFADMPHEVREAGGAKAYAFDNPLNRAIRSEQAGGYFRTLQQLAPLMQINPQVTKIFMQQFPADKVVKGLADINAVPASWAATDEELRAAQDQDAQQEQSQALLQALPTVGAAAKDISTAARNGDVA